MWLHTNAIANLNIVSSISNFYKIIEDTIQRWLILKGSVYCNVLHNNDHSKTQVYKLCDANHLANYRQRRAHSETDYTLRLLFLRVHVHDLVIYVDSREALV